MTDVARITKHPTDRDCVLLHTPPDAKDRLGRFGPARFSPDHHAYVLHHSHIDALYRFARTADMHVVDERRAGHEVVRTLPVECRSCGQAGSKFTPPAMCPTCGERWTPIEPPVREDPITKTPCPSCGHKQPGRFPYCASCGTEMAYQPVRVRARQPVKAETRRVHLDDPLPLGQVLAEEAPTPPPGLASTLPPATPTPESRTVEDVPLPDSPDPTPEQPTGRADGGWTVSPTETTGGCDCPRGRLPGEEPIGEIHEYDEWRCYPRMQPDGVTPIPHDRPTQDAEPTDEPVVEDPPTGWGWES